MIVRKLYIVKNQRDFDRIIKKGKFRKSKNYVIYYDDNDLAYDRFGISVGKKIGNAVHRNKHKRKLRSIIEKKKKMYVNSKDYIIAGDECYIRDCLINKRHTGSFFDEKASKEFVYKYSDEKYTVLLSHDI